MPLQLTDTLTGERHEFQPLRPGHVSLYVCGVTVYDHCHIGHARGAVVFDLLRRYLESDRYQFKVKHVRNITDVDDKIIDRARAEIAGGVSKTTDLKAATQEVARRYETSFQEDFAKLGLSPPTQEPRATKFIPQMIQFIENLIQAGYAYPGSDGVYFSVKKFEEKFGYGHLSHQKLEQMLEGVRGAQGEGKKEPLDFALWKKAKPDEPNWESPWGAGRPGWHIECSTMSTGILGDTFDIHGGGQDLIFPHHENELAQAVAAGKPFARMWLHNGLLTVNGQKMSKSLGNIVTIQEALKRHPNPDVLRLFFLSAHYRSPQDFTWERFDEAAHAYERLKSFLDRFDRFVGSGNEEKSEISEVAENAFYKAMDDDLNTPEALGVLYNLVAEAIPWLGGAHSEPGLILGGEGGEDLNTIHKYLRWVRDVVRLIRRLSRNILGMTFPEEGLDDRVKRLCAERDGARRNKDFKKSDEIRRQLMEQGYVIEDTSRGTVARKRV